MASRSDYQSVRRRLYRLIERIGARAAQTCDSRASARALWACRAADRASGTRVGTVLWERYACDTIDHSLHIGRQQRAARADAR